MAPFKVTTEGLLAKPTAAGIHDNLLQRLLTNAREVIVLQLPLLSLTRTEEKLDPVDVPVRAELVSLMANILVTVFQTERGKTDERATIQPQD